MLFRSSNLEESPLKNVRIVDIAVGDNHTVALDSEGKVWTWGYNYYGQLGDGTSEDKNIPQCISNIEDSILNGVNVTQISAGYNRIIVVDENNNIYGTGEGSYLGIGEEYTQKLGDYNTYKFVKLNNYMGNNIKVKKIKTSHYITAIIDENEEVWFFGQEHNGNMGIGSSDSYVFKYSPVCVNDINGSSLKDVKVKDVFIGDQTTAILDENGKVWTCGKNDYGQLGNGTTNDSSVFSCISYIEDSIIKDKVISYIALSNNTTSILDENGNLYSCGYNSDGRFGNGETSYNSTSLPVEGKILMTRRFKYMKFKEIAAGSSYTIAIDTDGDLWGAGYGNYLGIGSNSYYNLGGDSSVKLFYNISDYNELDTKFIKLSTSSYGFTAVLDIEGKVWTWGSSNSNYAQGKGETNDSNILYKVMCISDVDGSAINDVKIKEITANNNSITMVSEDGQVYVTGRYKIGENYYKIGRAHV